MSKKKKSVPIGEPGIMHDNYLFPAASSGDMTGLIPSGTEKDGDIDSYGDLYPFTDLQKAMIIERRNG